MSRKNGTTATTAQGNGHLAVEYRPLSGLIPYARNARTHSDEQIAQIAASIREFGWTNPVLVDGQNGIIAGHGRVLAAQKLGIEQAPCIELAHMTETQRKAYVLADNKLALNAGWDTELLKLEMLDLKALDFDISLIGFGEDELAQIMMSAEPAAVEETAPPGIPEVPVTVSGDLWILGKHRLLCGDCRDFSDVQRLTSGMKVNLVFTSPPYAEQREYDESSGFKPIPPDEYVEWFRDVAVNIRSVLADDGSYFLNIKPSADGLDTSLYVFDLVIAHVRQWQYHFATEFCWERNGVPKSVTRRFKNQFEPVYQFAIGQWKMRPDAVRHQSDNVPRPGGKGVGGTSWANAQGGNGPIFGAAKKRKHGVTDLMSDHQGHSAAPGELIGPGMAYPGNRLPTFASTHDATGHAAAFPVGLPDFFIRAYTDPDDVVYDPFMGSGSTLMAADQKQRIGLGTEISPAYCDVIVQRWQNFTGLHATLEGDGRTFEEIKAGRGGVVPVLPQPDIQAVQ